MDDGIKPAWCSLNYCNRTEQLQSFHPQSSPCIIRILLLTIQVSRKSLIPPGRQQLEKVNEKVHFHGANFFSLLKSTICCCCCCCPFVLFSLSKVVHLFPQ